MNRIMLWMVAGFAIINFTSDSYGITFSDNFNDGNLGGWTEKQGDWSNPGTYMESSFDNYGIIWKDDSFGYSQFLQIDAYFDGASTSTKVAHLRLRNGDAGSGSNPYFDHGYYALVKYDSVTIYNAVQPNVQQQIATVNIAALFESWRTLAFAVQGFGDQTNLQFWVDGQLVIDAFDTSGYQHDDGGYIALGSSNHLNRKIDYDNFVGSVDEPVSVPEPASIITLISALMVLFGLHKRINL